MYRAILPDGDIECTRYDRQDDGVELYNDEGVMIAFIPYANLVAILDEEAMIRDERSIM